VSDAHLLAYPVDRFKSLRCLRYALQLLHRIAQSSLNILALKIETGLAPRFYFS
jgi:hypothetical protein